MQLTILFPLFLILYEFCVNMSNDMYLPAVPAIGDDLSVAISLVQLTIAAWFAGNSSVQLIIGPLSDRFGRRPILFGGGVLFLLSTLGCALASSITLLIIARFIQGIGVCTLMVAGYASIHDLYDDKQAIHILIWMGSAAVIAPAVGPVLGGLILAFTSWRSIFVLLFLLSSLFLLVLWFVMPETPLGPSKQRLSIKTLVHSYGKILSNRSFMTSAASFGLLYGGIIGWITASPFLLMESLGLTPMQFGWLQVPVFGAYIVGAQMVKPLLERAGKEALIVFGLALSCVSVAAFIFFPILYPDRAFSFVLPIAGYALGFGFAAAPLNRITLTATGEQKGAAIALFYLMMMGLGTLISVVLSLLKESALSMTLVIGGAIVLAFILNGVRHNFQKVE